MKSCTMSGIKASTAPAPRPCRQRAARWDDRLVDEPAQKPPIKAAMPVSRSTGRRPTAMDSGTSRKLAMPLAIIGSVLSSAVWYSGGPPKEAREGQGVEIDRPAGMVEGYAAEDPGVDTGVLEHEDWQEDADDPLGR